MSTECDDDDAASHNASGHLVGQIESRSQSPHEPMTDGEDEQDEPNKSKTAKTGLRIKLSLKPLRKSSRERKVRVNTFILLDEEAYEINSTHVIYSKLLENFVGSA